MYELGKLNKMATVRIDGKTINKTTCIYFFIFNTQTHVCFNQTTGDKGDRMRCSYKLASG